MMNKNAIALAEDNPINKNSFLQKIELIGSYEVVFTAENGRIFLEKMASLPADRLPAAVFMDIEMPVLDGIRTIMAGKKLYSHVEFVVLTIFDDDAKIFDAIRAGASGYLLKHASAKDIEEALVNVMQYGGVPMSPSIARKALRLLADKPTEAAGSLPENITAREKELLSYLVKGWDARQIADKLFISVMTVRKHIANIYQKLHLSSQAQVINEAYRQRWFIEE